MSILTLRSKFAELLGKSFGGKRDLYKVFGYPTKLRAEDFYSVYLRNDIAQRIIKAYPQATWRDAPEVTSENESFGEDFQALYKKHKLANYFERADRLSSIGHFGLLLMGFQDGKSIAEPLEKGDHPLIYLTPYGEQNITVTQWNMDSQSPRYGLPETYSVQTGNPLGGKRSSTKSRNVHHSRVLHIAEMLDEDEVYGVPRLMAIYNRIRDLEKVVGGSSEMFWLAANKGLAFKADADAEFDDDGQDVKDQAEEYQHELRRFMTLQGVDIQELGSNVADPSNNVNVLVDLISGTTGIPKRILLGNEAGELASSQDETNWNARVDERRNTFAAPMMVRPFIDKMVMTGNLPDPSGGITVSWDEADALSEKEIAEIQKIRSETIDRISRAIPNFPQNELVTLFYPDKTEEEIQTIMSETPIEQP